MFSHKYDGQNFDTVDEDDKFMLSKTFPESQIHIHTGERCYHFNFEETEKFRESGFYFGDQTSWGIWRRTHERTCEE